MFYVWADKIGTVFAEDNTPLTDGNYMPCWTSCAKTYQVLGKWPETLWKQRKVTSEVYERLLLHQISDATTVLFWTGMLTIDILKVSYCFGFRFEFEHVPNIGPLKFPMHCFWWGDFGRCFCSMSWARQIEVRHCIPFMRCWQHVLIPFTPELLLCLFKALRLVFTLYYGKPSLSHHLGNIFFFQPPP